MFDNKGSSVSFVGNTPPRSEYNATTGAPPTHTVTIDDEISYNTTFPVGDESDSKVDQAYQWWYTSPFLNSTDPSRFDHRITIADTHDVAVDFAIITVTDPDTPLNLDLDPSGIGGRTRQVLVDDQDPDIHYEGDWVSTANSRYIKFGIPGGYPIANSTHQSRKDGDCLEFRFFGKPLPLLLRKTKFLPSVVVSTGSSIDVYAIWFPPSSLATSSDLVSQHLYITLDGKPQIPAIQGRPLSDRSNNVLIYSTSSGSSQGLSAGNHTLTLTYMQPESDANVALMQYLLFDYITYIPSFSSLRDRPDLSAGYKGCRGLAPDDDEVPIGLIVGVVLGLFVCALGTIGYVWWRNKKKKRRRNGVRARRTAFEGWVSISVSREDYPFLPAIRLTP